MTSNNIQKIVQNNLHLNPWLLSKNTNEILNACIQKIYKQRQHAMRKDLKPPKIATERPENKAPIRTFKSQQENAYSPSKIVPQNFQYPAKKSKVNASPKLNHNRLMQFLDTNDQLNLQIKKKYSVNSNATKKLLKSPNLKIYSSRRCSSSISSSRSSLFRRHDEKRRQKQLYPSHLNFMLRSIHSSQLVDNITKYIMPIRNQQMKGNLGSLPEALKVSSSIQNDLMAIDDVLRNRISVGGAEDGKGNSKSLEAMKPIAIDRLGVWKHPPSLDKFPLSNLEKILVNKETGTEKTTKSFLGQKNFKTKIEMDSCTTQNDSYGILEKDIKSPDFKEKHRRNRMKKLGLIKESPKPSRSNIIENHNESSQMQMRADNKMDIRQGYINRQELYSHPLLNYFPLVKAKEKKLPLKSCQNQTAPDYKSTSKRLYSNPSDIIVSPSSSETSTLPPDRLSQGPLALAAANISSFMSKNPSIYRHGNHRPFAMGKY
ncbi:uncharacterized protein LOC142231544 [Haematobia irritans]|uniref:uncharacterized protein LOC142231544 n=1 Tax=Haematobia irritans TaxID=7368 RepID=UPI003F5093C6